MTCWASSDDAVFLDDDEEREECVMNEVGIIYHGACDDIAERDWNYGQVVKRERSTSSVVFKMSFTSHKFLFSP